MDFKKVVVIGGGVLGSQIAYQSAYCGFDVTIWLRSEGSITRTQPKIEKLHSTYSKALQLMNTPEGKSPDKWCNGLASKDDFNFENCIKANDKAYSSVKLELDLDKALDNADLVIESLAEDPQAKTDFYKLAASKMPEKTIIVTNSSTLLPSMFAEATGRPEKYLSLHFANNIWYGNIAEVMNHAGTDLKYYDRVVEFAKAINMVPLCLHKEQPGYILNTLLVPLLNSGLYLWATGVSDPETIDKTWRLALGNPVGPFKILDMVGITTAYNIAMLKPGHDDISTPQGQICSKLKEMIDANKLGIATGEGFYKYNTSESNN